jgi:hypothetical protein
MRIESMLRFPIVDNCLMRWTNDRYRSTPHRVRIPEAERHSIAFFLDANPDAIVTPLLASPDERPRYAPISVRDYLLGRLDATYAHRQPHAVGQSHPVHTTIWRDLHSPGHAIRRMIDFGLRVTINTDDPGMFATDLSREYALAGEAFGLSESTLIEIAANGLSHCWTPQIARHTPPVAPGREAYR